jgi:hypothetical protein
MIEAATARSTLQTPDGRSVPPSKGPSFVAQHAGGLGAHPVDPNISLNLAAWMGREGANPRAVAKDVVVWDLPGGSTGFVANTADGKRVIGERKADGQTSMRQDGFPKEIAPTFPYKGDLENLSAFSVSDARSTQLVAQGTAAANPQVGEWQGDVRAFSGTFPDGTQFSGVQNRDGSGTLRANGEWQRREFGPGTDLATLPARGAEGIPMNREDVSFDPNRDPQVTVNPRTGQTGAYYRDGETGNWFKSGKVDDKTVVFTDRELQGYRDRLNADRDAATRREFAEQDARLSAETAKAERPMSPAEIEASVAATTAAIEERRAEVDRLAPPPSGSGPEEVPYSDPSGIRPPRERNQSLGHYLTRDAVVTNEMPASFNVWTIRQRPEDDSWRIEKLERGRQVPNVDAVLVDIDGDQKPDMGTRPPSSTVGRPHYDLVQNEMGVLECVPQGPFSVAGFVAANVAAPDSMTQGFFMDIDTFYRESPYFPKLPVPR